MSRILRDRQTIIPLLDLAKYHSNRQAFVEELREACHLVGFFLIRHDFQDVADTMLEESRLFFSRPLEEKAQISYSHSPSFRGYMPIGVENTMGKVDSREQIEWAVEYLTTGSDKQWPLYERLKSSENPWPSYQPSLKTATLNFTKEVCHVADCIRNALCQALGLDKDQQREFISMFEANDDTNERPHWVVKLISYPCVKDGEMEQGVGAHTDTNFLTLVLQDSVGGLQAYSKGEWIDVPVEFGTSFLVCNLGEQAQIWSRGYLLATPHRVKANTSGQARISVPLFYNPVLSATIEPISDKAVTTLQWDRPRDYQNWERNNNTMHASVGENTFKSLARSHPDVFNKHHPDLVIRDDGHIFNKRG